ncbi:hypothetical protein [Streptomyces sp900116325]|uniref:hypothetical protein n=1 Tax=Streptomyces sp. 900116325 TaxID=3154295 RepID=UPI0033F65C80
MDLLLPELDPADSLVDWAAVTVGVFTAQAVSRGVEGMVACEVRMDGEHLYASGETTDRARWHLQVSAPAAAWST